ncbi:MAG TPA: pilin [bacterium]|nr:pilin [bacterium]
MCIFYPYLSCIAAEPSWEVKTIFGVTVSSESALEDYINLFLNFLYQIIGSITVLRIIIGGYRYTMSAGNPNQVRAAKKTIIRSLIGLTLVLTAYLITNTLFDIIIQSQS